MQSIATKLDVTGRITELTKLVKTSANPLYAHALAKIYRKRSMQKMAAITPEITNDKEAHKQCIQSGEFDLKMSVKFAGVARSLCEIGSENKDEHHASVMLMIANMSENSDKFNLYEDILHLHIDTLQNTAEMKQVANTHDEVLENYPLAKEIYDTYELATRTFDIVDGAFGIKNEKDRVEQFGRLVNLNLFHDDWTLEGGDATWKRWMDESIRVGKIVGERITFEEGGALEKWRKQWMVLNKYMDTLKGLGVASEAEHTVVKDYWAALLR